MGNVKTKKKEGYGIPKYASFRCGCNHVTVLVPDAVAPGKNMTLDLENQRDTEEDVITITCENCGRSTSMGLIPNISLRDQ